MLSKGVEHNYHEGLSSNYQCLSKSKAAGIDPTFASSSSSPFFSVDHLQLF